MMKSTERTIDTDLSAIPIEWIHLNRKAAKRYGVVSGKLMCLDPSSLMNVMIETYLNMMKDKSMPQIESLVKGLPDSFQ